MCVCVRVCVFERRIYLLCGSTKSTIIFKPLRSIRMLILFSLSLCLSSSLSLCAFFFYFFLKRLSGIVIAPLLLLLLLGDIKIPHKNIWLICTYRNVQPKMKVNAYENGISNTQKSQGERGERRDVKRERRL